MFSKILIAGLCLAVSWAQGAEIRMYQNGPSSEALAAVAGLDDKADKVLPYTHLTGANVTVSPSMSYVWETTAGTNVLTATGFTEGVDASCSMVITMYDGDTITASGLTFVDELEPGVNHCFIRQMPMGGVQLYVSYVGDLYGDIFVDGSALAGGDGTSWRTPYKEIQDAIDGATTGNLILVKPGTYQPIDSLDNSITIESTGGAEVTTIDGNDSTRCARLVNATLNGFKLTKGVAMEGWEDPENEGKGGGSLGGTLNNCILTGNGAMHGGGSYNSTLNNCTLTGNTSYFEGGGSFGGTLNNCTLSGNMVHGGGGGSSGGTLNNCILTGNEADGGGGSYNSTLNNCTLTGNSAMEGGGSNGGTLNNCTLTGNTAEAGGGSHGGKLNNCTLTGNSADGAGGSFEGTLNNCILWGNTSIPDMGPAGSENYSDSTFNYCNTSPLPAGTGNISEDPKFVSGSNLRLQASSPCINAGSNDYVTTATDLDGNPRVVGGTVDMGAYEYQGE